jgi:hypothetical protein
MIRIFKYPIQIVEYQEIYMQEGLIRHVGLDPYGTPCIWAEVQDTSDMIWRIVNIRGTGHAITGEEGNFIGTFVHDQCVWHVFSRL